MSVDTQNEDQKQEPNAQPEVDAVDTSPAPESELDAEKLNAELDNLRDQLMRAVAETQNVRRRAEQDVEKAHKFALEKFAKELLPVVDSLEKSIESSQGEEGERLASIREGVEMTLALMLGVLNRFNVDVVDPLGAPFDPQLHEAMSMVEQPTAEPNSVIAVVQKGYTLNGRLLRPAMVVVAKGGSAAKVEIGRDTSELQSRPHLVCRLLLE